MCFVNLNEFETHRRTTYHIPHTGTVVGGVSSVYDTACVLQNDVLWERMGLVDAWVEWRYVEMASWYFVGLGVVV